MDVSKGKKRDRRPSPENGLNAGRCGDPDQPRDQAQSVPSRRCGLTYALVTPARNEAEFIGLTIESVIAQTCLPVTWVIVSDGSTDGTDEIVERYLQHHAWIRLLRIPNRHERHFAGKVYAFNAGYDLLRSVTYDVIGNLDADISLDDRDYFTFLLTEFAKNPALGVAGTPFREGHLQYDYRFADIRHVSGACQLFRRECFEVIGGYKPLRGGGIDWLAVTSARMAGWQTRTFTGMTCVHNRPMGTAQRSALVARFMLGAKDYRLGGHPVWEIFRCAYQMTTKPYVLGGLILLAGYVWASIFGRQRSIPADVIEFHRAEQMHRLKALSRRIFRRAGP
jgi:glycosyltransferase involved in cell wall biosynthesis